MQPNIEKKEKWQQWLCEWRASGLNPTDFCRRKGIGHKQFYNCRKALAPETVGMSTHHSCKDVLGTTEALELVRLKPSQGGRLFGSGVSLSCNGIHISLDSGFDECVLRSALSVIGGRSC